MATEQRVILKGDDIVPTDLQSRAQYLVLAEFCQGIINSLSDYRDGIAGLPRNVIKNAVDALRSAETGESYRFDQKPAAALGSYEQVRTLEQVFRKPDQLEEALSLLNGLLTENSQQSDANDVIKLFTRLQTKALWNFEQPVPIAPPDIGELCRAFKTA